MAFDPQYADAISGIESGGNYAAMGPATSSGDRAHGKYQILGANIGPWSKEILGQEVTPQQFLANPQIQDAIFQGKFQQYVDKYGPEGAAQAWIGGPGGVGKLDRKDSLGTSIGAYGQKFMAALGAPQASLADPNPKGPSFGSAGAVDFGAPGTPGIPPVPVSPQGMPAYGWSPNNAPTGISGAQPSQPAMPVSQPEPLQVPQMQPLGAPMRRPPPDLTALQAFLSRSPAPSAGFRFSRIS